MYLHRYELLIESYIYHRETTDIHCINVLPTYDTLPKRLIFMVLFAKKRPSPPRQTVQSLGGRTYALPDVTVARSSGSRTSPSSSTSVFFLPQLQKTLKRVGVIIGMPFYTATMLIAPQKIRSKILGWFIPKVMAGLADITHNQRKLLLQHVSGRVLDVGSGGGAYLRHLKGASHVVCIEPIRECHPKIRTSAVEAGFQEYQVTIVGDTLEAYVQNNPYDKFDWVILGNVMCEVPDQRSTINCITSVLKPGGHVYFCEHIASPRGMSMRRIQDIINPFWNRVSGGCNCNRDTLHALEGVHDWDIISWDLSLSVGGNRMVMGLAQKDDSIVEDP